MILLELCDQLNRLRNIQWHLDTISSYATAHTLTPEIEKLEQQIAERQKELATWTS